MKHRRPFGRVKQASKAGQPRVGAWSSSCRACWSQCATSHVRGTFHHYLCLCCSRSGLARQRCGSGAGSVARTCRQTTWNSTYSISFPCRASPRCALRRHLRRRSSPGTMGQVHPTPAPSSAFFPRNQGFPLRRYSGNRRRPVGFGVTGSCAGRGRRVADDQLSTWNSTRSVTFPRLASPRCAYAGTSFGVARSDTIGRGGGGRWGPHCPACPGYTLSPVPTRTDTAGRSA